MIAKDPRRRHPQTLQDL